MGNYELHVPLENVSLYAKIYDQWKSTNVFEEWKRQRIFLAGQGFKKNLKRLESLATPDMIRQSRNNPEIAGIVFLEEPVFLLGGGEEEFEMIRDQYKELSESLYQGMVADAGMRALAYLAVGPEGVNQLKRGKSPEGMDLHHVIPKSCIPLRVCGRSINSHRFLNYINTPSNLVGVSCFPEEKEKDVHCFWESCIIWPQKAGEIHREKNVFFPQPVFPFYWPTQRIYRSLNDIMNTLEEYEPGIKKELSEEGWPEIWGRRILAFCEAMKNQEPRIPRRFFKSMEIYRELFPSGKKKEMTYNQRVGLKRRLTKFSVSAARSVLPSSFLLH